MQTIRRDLIIAERNKRRHGFFEITMISKNAIDDSVTAHWSALLQNQTNGVVYGEDSVQCIALCLRLMNSLIEAYEANGSKIYWIKEGLPAKVTI